MGYYWLERTGRRLTIVTLRSAPIDIAPALRETLLKRNTSAIFTSATLAMGRRIEPFQQRIGGPDVRAAVEKSPFDFERHMRVFAATDIPLPSPKDARLALDALTDYIRFCALRVPGGSLVLFTSYNDMRAAAQMLARDFTGSNRPFLMQGDGLCCEAKHPDWSNRSSTASCWRTTACANSCTRPRWPMTLIRTG
jgi:ATP-dependent DNA helicase DinG